ncbi:divalent metal cation transporter, partial [Corynebacterium amycolatum]|uniref:divalent metal cation transporter n=1 Tax=Corynebacterium amycolatum TaxID=43765 RepID=UPI00351D03C0
LGGVIVGVVSLGLLLLQGGRSQRTFEGVIVAFLLVITVGFLAGLFVTGLSLGEMASGILPRFQGAHTVVLAASMLGATVMPHAVYLHSGLVRDREYKVEDDASLRQHLRATRIDVFGALVLAGSVNIGMLCLAAEALPGVEGTDSIEGAHAGVEIGDGGQHHARFAEARQHAGDVVEEGRVRADDEDTGFRQLIAVGVEKPRDAMQRHRRLARAGTALDNQGAAGGIADDEVLLALNGLHNAAHMAGARLIHYLAQHRFATDTSLDFGLGCAVGFLAGEPFVVNAADLPAVRAQVATQADSLGMRGRGQVERARAVGSPVHDDRAVVVVFIGQADSPDVSLVDGRPRPFL